jgi:hypothetical protein
LLALTNQQLEQVKQAATMVPPGNRDNFLRSVAAQLVRHHDLAQAIAFVLSGRNVSASRSLFLNQRRPRRFARAPRRSNHAL